MNIIICGLFGVLLREVNAFCGTEGLEPCFFKNNEELPYVATRHPSISYSSTTDDTKFCDLYALNHGQWYRSSYNMTNYCVDHRKCGTNDPIYLKGNISNPADGVVDSTACVRTFQNRCEHTLNLRMKNCGYFMVYCFLDLHPACHSRFCFDVDLSVETTTTMRTTTTTTTRTTRKTTAATTTKPTTSATSYQENYGCTGDKIGKETLAIWFISVVVLVIAFTTSLTVCILKYRMGRDASKNTVFMVLSEKAPYPTYKPLDEKKILL